METVMSNESVAVLSAVSAYEPTSTYRLILFQDGERQQKGNSEIGKDNLWSILWCRKSFSRNSLGCHLCDSYWLTICFVIRRF